MRISIENTTSKTVKKNRSSVGMPGKGVCFGMFEKRALISKEVNARKWKILGRTW